ncbi:MAG: type II secretion system F family protein [Alphaproteobacteria bacterium]|nr:type II secretion system F family protein [Alphaproteobacteria bacterium]
MDSFSYVAINEHGRTIRGTVSADNELDLEARLKQAGLDLVNARKVREKKAGFLSRVKTHDLIVLCLHLEQLDRAGVPLHEALADIRDTAESPKLKDVLTNVYESVKNGSMLSAALADYPKVFNEVFTGLVAAGEKTGKLSEAFGHLAHHLKWLSEIRRKVKKAVRYPAVLIVVISLVVSVMMLYVVPKLTTFILSQGFAVPFHTRALIAVSDAFQNYWYVIFGIPVLAISTLLFFYRRSPEFAYRVDNILLRAPIVGPVIRKIDMARFTHFFSVMFNSGIDVLESLRTAGGVVKNRVLKEAVEAVRNSVTEGNSLTAALRISSQFPNLVIRMFKVGEDSGNMREALENVNFFYDREVNDAVDSLIGMIQPALTVVMGLIIFWVISAIFGPLYESFSKMKF